MDTAIRLLFLTDTYLGGFAGSERYLEKLCFGLNPELFAIKVIQLANKAIPYPDGVVQNHSNVALEQVRLSAVYSGTGWRLRHRLGREFSEGRYDIVHSLHEKADLLSLTSRGRVVRISGRRDIGFKKGTALRTFFRYTNRRFDRFVVPARAIADGLVADEGVLAERIEVIPNGLDLDRFRQHSGRHRIRNELGLAEDSLVVGCVANLKPVKRHDLLLSAFSMLAGKQRNASLLFVGQGALEDKLTRQAGELGISDRVHFLGQRSDVPDLLTAMDMLVSASDSEGLSNTLIEAAAMGVPAIATAVGGSPEIVDDGQTGILVPANNADAMAKAIDELCSEPGLRSKMSDNARKKADRMWSLRSMIHSHEAVYRELAANRGRAA